MKLSHSEILIRVSQRKKNSTTEYGGDGTLVEMNNITGSPAGLSRVNGVGRSSAKT